MRRRKKGRERRKRREERRRRGCGWEGKVPQPFPQLFLHTPSLRCLLSFLFPSFTFHPSLSQEHKTSFLVFMPKAISAMPRGAPSIPKTEAQDPAASPPLRASGKFLPLSPPQTLFLDPYSSGTKFIITSSKKPTWLGLA